MHARQCAGGGGGLGTAGDSAGAGRCARRRAPCARPRDLCGDNAGAAAAGVCAAHLTQVLERYADVFGRGADGGGEEKAAAAAAAAGRRGLAEMSAASAALYFEKHHYRVLSRADGLAARLQYDGHVRALAEAGGAGAVARLPGEAGGEGDGADRRPAAVPRVVCECAPWFTLRFPRPKSLRPSLDADDKAVSKGAAAAAEPRPATAAGAAGAAAAVAAAAVEDGLRPVSRSLSSAAAGRPRSGPSDLQVHFRFFQERPPAGALAAANRAEMLRAMFRAKCKELGIKPIAEQEAGFVERAQRGLAGEEQLRLSDLGLGPSAVPALGDALAAPDCRAEGLDLSNNPLRDAGGAALGRLLPRWVGLRRLDLRSAGLGDGGVAALVEGMRKDTLTRLDLGCCAGSLLGRNVVGARGSEAVARLLVQTSSLVWLSLGSTQLAPESATVLSKGLRQNLTLRMLDLGDNLIGDAGASNVLTAAISADLRELSLERNEISDRSAPHFAALLDSDRVALERLDVRGNKISSQVAAAIASSLSLRNTSLTSLVLDSNELKGSGAAALAKALAMEEFCTMDMGRKVEVQMKYPRSLMILKLAQNDVKDEGATKLCAILRQNWTLTTLDLSGNSIGDSGARAVGKCLSVNSSLVNLSLAWNLIGDSGIALLGQFIQLNLALKTLNLEGNKFSESGAENIVGFLAVCSNLCELNVDFNKVSFNHSEAIKLLLDKNKKLYEENSVIRQQNEIQRLSLRDAQSPDILQKLKSEERALKNRNDAIKDVKTKMQEAKSNMNLRISEIDQQMLIAAERLNKIESAMRNCNVKTR